MQAPPHTSFERRLELRRVHSFPTRRSSDLSRGGSSIPLSAATKEVDGHPVIGIEVQQGYKFPMTGSPSTSLVAADSGDRKSTRLNSSHRCSSYAVFCLKKKRMST